MAWYIDTSAVVKLITVEPETRAMHEWVATTSPELVASDLLRTELLRAAARIGMADLLPIAEALDAIDFLPATAGVFDAAGRLEPVGLRSLDAIHLATALDLDEDCDGIVAYDDRLLRAAAAHGLTSLSPA